MSALRIPKGYKIYRKRNIINPVCGIFVIVVAVLHLMHIFSPIQSSMDDLQSQFRAYEQCQEQVQHISEHWDRAQGLLLLPFPNEAPQAAENASTGKQVSLLTVSFLLNLTLLRKLEKDIFSLFYSPKLWHAIVQIFYILNIIYKHNIIDKMGFWFWAVIVMCIIEICMYK